MNETLKSLIFELENDTSYQNYLDKNKVKYFFPENFFTLKTEQERLDAWENIKVKLKEIKDFNKVANPYYIGFGNPEADLLIMGQEKAFNAFAHPKLMLYESINNSFQWSKIIENNGDLSEINFDPRNPRKHHDKGRSGNHTWSKYSILTDAFYGINSCHENMKKHWNQNTGDTLFDKAFTTELNVTPAVSNSGLHLIDERKEFLSNPFFKKFKVVVFAIGNPSNEEVVKKIFSEAIFENYNLGSYGTDKKREVSISKNTSQIIVICNQLSGSSGWKNEHIVALGEKLRALT
ncbi:hypothetical protein QYS49_34695 [Marivirga salinae]|uniref:Uncharacterized protein n=1 Tax=Marivirga salinarum TaxID=3059078 RepID=A0AA51NCU3_9BACT|nr:hypothetical protein [Marivirga sp. BDSF4-3]WMN12808.1 hypothetical protein QYS49_34695 [Marivirga sp. BDSF4-3]